MKIVIRYALIIALAALMVSTFLASLGVDCPNGSVSASGIAMCK
jgi:hypothetical protein